MPRQNLIGLINLHFKVMKGRKLKHVLSRGAYQWHGEGIKKG
jgi:hypothetical protein